MVDVNSDLARQQASEMFAQLAALPIPQFVFNGFTNNMTPGDISSVLGFGPRPLAILTMSPVMAKTYAIALLALVSEYEKESGQPVMTVQQFNERRSTQAPENV